MEQYEAKIIRRCWRTNDILEVVIKPQRFVSYVPGQYLIWFIKNEPVYFSIASIPTEDETYTLHIRLSPDNHAHDYIRECIDGSDILIGLPRGFCHVDALDRKKDIHFIAGGTGIVPVYSMISYLLQEPKQSNFSVLWCVETKEDAYLDAEFCALQKARYFDYQLLVTHNAMTPLTHWIDNNNLRAWHEDQCVFSGSPEMVLALKKLFMRVGVPEKSLYSDMFEFIKEDV